MALVGWGALFERSGGSMHIDRGHCSLPNTLPITERRITLAVMTTLEDCLLTSTDQLVDKGPGWGEGP